MKIEEIKNIPREHIDEVRSDYESSGARVVKMEQQQDGRWRVVAEFPDGAQYPTSGSLVG